MKTNSPSKFQSIVAIVVFTFSGFGAFAQAQTAAAPAYGKTTLEIANEMWEKNGCDDPAKASSVRCQSASKELGQGNACADGKALVEEANKKVTPRIRAAWGACLDREASAGDALDDDDDILQDIIEAAKAGDAKAAAQLQKGTAL